MKPSEPRPASASGPRRRGTNPPDGAAPRTGLSAFEQAVATAIRAIPPGQTLSYGGVALRAGKPRGARAVVQALRRLRDVPWWRVIRSDGTLAAEVAAEQAPRLRGEGVRVDGRRVRRARGEDARGRRDEASRSAGPGARKRNKLSR